MPRSDDRAPASEGTLDWHIDKVFELADEEIKRGEIDPSDMLKSLYTSFLFRTREYLGVSKQQVFDANDEIKSLFHSAWMEEAKHEIKH